ncbi:unannotated protein [freshwater metagenome]|uniref:Unannotated protein n=1 Tax=freshwater metagenome TaxID=449393 RepID=A0A6J6KUB0_9ZZZZ
MPSDDQGPSLRFKAENTSLSCVACGFGTLWGHDLWHHQGTFLDCCTEWFAKRHTDIRWPAAISGSSDLSRDPLRVVGIRTLGR